MKPRPALKENSPVLVLLWTSVFSISSMVTLTAEDETRLCSKQPRFDSSDQPYLWLQGDLLISPLKAFHYIWHFQSWQDKSEGRAKRCLMMQVLKHSWIFKKKYTKQLPDSKRAVSGMGNFYIRPHPDREVLFTKLRVCLGGSNNDLVLHFIFF